MIDLGVVQPNLVETADKGELQEMREKKGQNSKWKAHRPSHTGSDIYAIHRAAEEHYSWS